jgi:hypothetical protein
MRGPCALFPSISGPCPARSLRMVGAAHAGDSASAPPVVGTSGQMPVSQVFPGAVGQALRREICMISHSVAPDM